MPKLRNANTGVVVSVSDATASRLGSEWVDASNKPEAEPKQKPGRPKKS